MVVESIKLYVLIAKIQQTGKNITSAAKSACNDAGIVYSDNIRRKYSAWRHRNPQIIKEIEGVETESATQIAAPTQFEVAKGKVLKEKQIYIITWAQNATPVHKKFWENLQRYAEALDAEIHVIAGRYKNPTSVFVDKEEDWWDPSVIPYLDANRHRIHDYLILSDVKTQPTAKRPLTGFESISGRESCIVGHPKVAMVSLPTMGVNEKYLYTTGACTVSNYTDSKAGKVGDFHHTIGFAILETTGTGRSYCRIVTADDESGAFTDISTHVEDGNISKRNIEVLTCGDVHYTAHLDCVLNAQIDLARNLSARTVVLHDLCDSKAVNPHEAKDPYKLSDSESAGLLDLEAEVKSIERFLENNRDLWFVIVRSNHDDMIDRWLSNDWRAGHQKKLYLKLAAAKAAGQMPKGALQYMLKGCYNAKFLGDQDSHIIGGVEYAIHGHHGLNGARGSTAGFAKLSSKVTVGHSHSPAIIDGVYCVGTCTKRRQDYMKGPSSAAHAFEIQHISGKRQLLVQAPDGSFTIQKGHYK